MLRSCLPAAMIVAMGCVPTGAPPAPSDETTGAAGRDEPAQVQAPPLQLPDGGAHFVVKQRSRRAIPGAGDKYFVSLGDITAGQVNLSIEGADGNLVVPGASRRPGEVVAFELEGHRYEATIESFDLHTLHEDSATVRVAQQRARSDRPLRPLSHEQQIESLIAAVEESGAVFIRNGEEHTAADAADHLRKKRERAGEQVRTPEEFIEQLATGSSVSGEPYMMRLPDGRTQKAADFLHERLREEERRVMGSGR